MVPTQVGHAISEIYQKKTENIHAIMVNVFTHFPFQAKFLFSIPVLNKINSNCNKFKEYAENVLIFTYFYGAVHLTFFVLCVFCSVCIMK